MKRGAKAAPRRRPSLILLMAGFSTILLLLSAVVTILTYRLIAERYYIRSLESDLENTLDALIEADFQESALSEVRNDVRIFLVDAETGRITYVDRYFNVAGFTDAVSGATEAPAEPVPPSDGRLAVPPAEPSRQRAAETLIEAVDRSLDGEGRYFASDDWDSRGERILESKALYLNGLQNGKYFSLCLTVESGNTALALAIRFSIAATILVWFVGMFLILLFYRKLTRTSSAIVKAADQISRRDFTAHCPRAFSREFTALSQSVNRMADQMQDYVGQLQSGNRQLTDELAERSRQQRVTRDLIANLSHDLKTPIAIISGYAEGLVEGVAKTEDQRADYAAMILRESEHMQGIVLEMLALSKLESGKVTPVPSDFDLSELVGEELQGFRPLIEKYGISLEASLAPGLVVYSDCDRVRQVVLNYIQNSIYHISGTHIRVVTERAAQRAVFRIANDSPPFTEQELTGIWEKLYRCDNARSRDHGEAGLGLSIVRSNMRLLGEPYGVRNLEAEGMVEFWIELPLAEEPGRPPETE